MKLILVGGLEQTNKNKLLGMAISTLNNGNGYKDFNLINFNGATSVRDSFLVNGNLKETYLSMYDDLQKTLTNSKRNAFNIVLDAALTVNTEYGYMPLLTENFFRIFKPNAMLLIENKLEDFKENPRDLLSVKEHQEINKSYAIKIASEFGIPVKIIKVNKTELKSTVKDIQDYLVSIHRTN